MGKNAKNHIEKAFEMLSDVSVKGVDVERLVNIKNELRLAYSMLPSADEEVDEDG